MALYLHNLFDNLFRLPELKGFDKSDFDSVEATAIQREIFKKKKIMGIIYHEYCRPFRESANRASKNAKMLEIGSGVSPLKEFIPDLISTDMFLCPWLDLTSSAYFLPFKNNSLDRIFLMFVCHHLGKIKGFLDEARRCLKSGGEMVIIDPAITIFSKFYYKYFHVDKMDLQLKEWYFDGEGRLSNSNIAMAWIIFFRDRERFKKLYPDFIIEKIEYNTCLAFILSGGLRIRQLLPASILKILFNVENWIIQHITNKIAVTMSLTIKRL
jgi:SAM-dependent methyltransferase